MRFAGSSSSNVNGTDGMVYGTGKEVKMRLEQQRQTQPKASQHPNDSVTPIISSGGCSDDQPGMLHKYFQSQETVPGHHTNSPVPGEQDLTGSFPAFPTPDDYKCEQESSSSTATEICVAQDSDYGSRISSTALMIDYGLIATEKSTASTDELSVTHSDFLDTKLHDSSTDDQSFPMEYSKMEFSPVPAQQDLWLYTDGQSCSTFSFADVQNHSDKTLSSSSSLRAINATQKNKPTRRMSHKKVHRNSFRRAMEATVEFRKTRRQKRGNKRRGSMKMNNNDVELTAEEQAMREFPGIPVQKAMEAFARKEEARAARALEPNFIYDEQRLVMEDFEAEHRLELVDQLEHEEEVVGWMIGDNVEDGFDVGIEDGMDVGVLDRDFWMVNGLEDQDDLAWMEGDDVFALSSLALTPPHH